MRPHLVRSLVALVVLVSGLAVAGCGGAAATAAPTYPPGAVVLTADARKFDTSELHVPAGTTFTLVFENRDSDQHNVAIRTKAGFEGDVVFRFDPVLRGTKVVEAGPLAPGTYYFLCEVHPTMTGTVVAR